MIDGTGEAAVRADVAIADGRIVGVGPRLSSEFPEVDLSGLVLTPGFVDPHTHYDAQILWDPDLTPSSWHGVTTVVMGNCGFTMAPTRPRHREVVLRTLENVEGMTLETLRAGVPWSFESFPEYAGVIDALPTRLNTALMVGHTAVRWYVMGDDAPDRAATPSEVDAMCRVVAEAIECGAVGMSTSRHTHVGAFGKPVPSRAATHDEIRALAGTLGRAGRGAIELAIGESFGLGDVVALAEGCGRPVTWSGSVLMPAAAEHGERAARAAVEICAAAGGEVVPQFACRPIVNQLTLRDPLPLRSASPAFFEVLEVESSEREALYRDEAWRRKAREHLAPIWLERLADARIRETGIHSRLRHGPTLGELAARDGSTPFDLLIDLSLAENLATRFEIAVANTDEDVIGLLLRDPRCMVGLSDAGAHVTQLCDANYATHLLGYWVRDRGTLPLEMAVWRLTGQPAALYGLHDRGRIARGAAADLVAFDPARVGTGEARRVWDFPGGTDRLVATSVGIEHVWVNGAPVRADGADVEGVSPGRRLRGSPTVPSRAGSSRPR